jgi:predicted unusual protein kinase regulating ubiquinone biosynthesis (AarF/ABC1/UbiB family)
VDGLGEVLFQFPFHVPAYYALILRSLTVLEGLALQADPRWLFEEGGCFKIKKDLKILHQDRKILRYFFKILMI